MSTISILNCGNFRLRASRCYKMSFQRNSVILQCCFFSNKEVLLLQHLLYFPSNTYFNLKTVGSAKLGFLRKYVLTLSVNFSWDKIIKEIVNYHRRISTKCIILRVAVCQISGCRMVTVLNVRVVILTLL